MTFEEFKKDMLKLYDDVKRHLHVEPPSDERMLELYFAQVVVSEFERKELKRKERW